MGEKNTNLMGGARLSPGGLHLGHYLGCFTPLEEYSGGRYFFVIRDRGLTRTFNSMKANRDFLGMVSDVKATSQGGRMNVVPQEYLYPYFRQLQDFLLDIITFRQLQNCHPTRKKLKNDNDFTLSLKDFLFPIETISTYFILDIDYVMMNDDSLRFVRFGKKVSQKLSYLNRGKPLVKSPQLRHGRLPRLLGYNYQKVSKGRKNCIFLSDDDVTLAYKVKQLFSFKHLFIYEPNFKTVYSESPSRFRLPECFLPLKYLLAFDRRISEEELLRYRNPELQPELEKRLFNVLQKLLRLIRERRTYLIGHPKKCWEYVEEGMEEAQGVAKGVRERIEGFVNDHSQERRDD